MNLTHKHFSLNIELYELREAIEKNDYDLACDLLIKWKKEKQRFYKTFKKLEGSGACLSDDVWTLGHTKSLFECEDRLQELFGMKPDKSVEKEIAALLTKLNSWRL